jgi:hypothetical protein
VWWQPTLPQLQVQTFVPFFWQSILIAVEESLEQKSAQKRAGLNLWKTTLQTRETLREP